MKIKVFDFKISDYSMEVVGVEIRTEEIELIVNNFMKNKEILSVDVKTQTIHQHNNARCDTVFLIYTIMYKA